MTMTYIPPRVTVGLRLWIVGVGGLESCLMMMVTMLTAWSRLELGKARTLSLQTL